jgi:hypothetical protein
MLLLLAAVKLFPADLAHAVNNGLYEEIVYFRNPEPGTFPSRRAAVAVDNSNDIHIVNMSLQTTAPGQAVGLLITGDRNILSHVTLIGSGEAPSSRYTH